VGLRWQKWFLDSSTPLPEAFTISEVQTVSSHLNQPGWAVQLVTVTQGRRRLVPASAIDDYVALLLKEAGRGRAA